MAATHVGHLLALLHLCDSLFPLGSFAHSDGLEAATSSGLVATGADLRGWMNTTRDEVLGRTDGPALRIAFEAFCRGSFVDVLRVDDELHALRPCAAARQASRAMGGRLLKTWQAIRPHHELARLIGFRGRMSAASSFTLPIAFGVVCAGAAVPLAAALEGFFYTRLAATVSAAMRLIAVGQYEAHALLAEALEGVPAAVDVAMSAAAPSSFVPWLDVMAMSQQYVHSRLFRS